MADLIHDFLFDSARRTPAAEALVYGTTMVLTVFLLLLVLLVGNVLVALKVPNRLDATENLQAQYGNVTIVETLG